MIDIKSFTFNPFAENTYVLHDETKECIIIDPGCYERHEEQAIGAYIAKEELTPVRLINTHCHIDHVLGNHFIAKTYGLELEVHALEVDVLTSVSSYSSLYGINYIESPLPGKLLVEGEQVRFGNVALDIIFVPGHCPGHIALVCPEQEFVINGDVLFREGVGRTDLPGGDYDTLIRSIKEKLFALPDSYTVYSGHGPSTTIGHEKQRNPFVAFSAD